ncbi:MAG: cytochrome c [Paucimonas sp.]|nr:cytochrome c [Paucimonas sp.]
MKSTRLHPALRMLLLALGLLFALVLAIFAWQLLHEPGRDIQAVPVADAAAQRVRGEYLARAGDCMACHTARGGAALAGGRSIPTPFGNLVSPNITPDPETGIGKWSADDFWRAMHNGRGRDGRFLYPAFPYPNYTRVTREDSDAIHAWLRSVAPVRQANAEHSLRFPYNQRWLLAGWRALYFRPGVFQADASATPQLNRGAYLVQGLGHCNACHASRNLLGATTVSGELTGGLIPMLNWYSPSLTSSAEGMQQWHSADLAALMKTGVSSRGAVFGPMAEVVRESLQYLTDEDIAAIAGYIKSLPPTPQLHADLAGSSRIRDRAGILRLGATLYEKNCAECHGADGHGKPPGFPPLRGNGSVMTPSAVNAVRMVLNGGYPPSTAGNPRPFGMPPYGPFMTDAEVAAVVSYVRTSWGNGGGLVLPSEVAKSRTVPVE